MSDKPEPIELDLRRDLPKVRELANFDDMGACLYASPCAVGAMIPEDRRGDLDEGSLKGVQYLLNEGVISAPEGQHDDIADLQWHFDQVSRDRFFERLAELESKYLGQPS